MTQLGGFDSKAAGRRIRVAARPPIVGAVSDAQTFPTPSETQIQPRLTIRTAMASAKPATNSCRDGKRRYGSCRLPSTACWLAVLLWTTVSFGTEDSPASTQTASPFTIDFRGGPVSMLTTNIKPRGDKMPADVASARLEEIADLSHASVLLREWMGLRYSWDAPAFCHQPLYFEEANLERYGYGPRYARVFQPVLSGAHFFATVPVLPYKMAADPLWSRVSNLGHYRPGSPAPYRVMHPSLSARGGLAEAATVLGLIVLIP
jgi:hypothetical protein